MGTVGFMERIPGAPVDTVFIDPPPLLSQGYDSFSIDPGLYYAREARAEQQRVGGKRKRRKKKMTYVLNPKEMLADQRHQHGRYTFMCDKTAQSKLKEIAETVAENKQSEQSVDFIALSQTFQAPLYEITLSSQAETVPLFNNIVEASSSGGEIASCAGSDFVVPKHSRFLMTDFSEIHRLIPDSPENGYNVIIIDPPWENKSVHRKSVYPTLPNKYLLSLPFQQLVHRNGALLGLWITNREKLHQFVEKELFPAWNVDPIGIWYWLKINETGEMVSELDLHHHKPYECLLLAETRSQENKVVVPRRLVAISVPSQHSRKPPLGLLLAEYGAVRKPVRALELFARDLNAHWTSWGNEPLRFQSKDYFVKRVSAD